MWRESCLRGEDAPRSEVGALNRSIKYPKRGISPYKTKKPIVFSVLAVISASLLLEFLEPGIAVLSSQWLDYQPIANGFCRRLDADGLAINHRPDSLDIGLDLALGDSTGLEANPALVLGATAIVDLATGGRSGTGKLADTWHGGLLRRNNENRAW